MYAPEGNEEHVEVTANNSLWFENEIKGTPTPVNCNYPPLTASITGPTYVYPCERGEWRANVSGGAGTYTYEWYVNNSLASTYNFYAHYNDNTYTEYLSITLIVKSGGQQATNGIYFTFEGCPSTQGTAYQVYPNPTESELNVVANDEQTDGLVTEEKENFDILLYNEFSQVVKESKSKNGAVKVDVKDLPAGIYYLHIKDTKGLTRKKISVERGT